MFFVSGLLVFIHIAILNTSYCEIPCATSLLFRKYVMSVMASNRFSVRLGL